MPIPVHTFVGEPSERFPWPFFGAPLLRGQELPPSEHVTLVHGDLHVRHVLLDAGALAGVIDWGDVCRADPAIDLVPAWTLLGPDGRQRFVAEYGAVDDAQLVRSRVLALYLGLMLLLYARDVGFAGPERECLAGLERTLVDWT